MSDWRDWFGGTSGIPGTGTDLGTSFTDWTSGFVSTPQLRRVLLTGPDRPPEVAELEFRGFSVGPQPEEPWWQRVLKGAASVLGVFEPLLFVGDIAKAGIYGYAEGGIQGAFRRIREQASEWASYAPFGKPPAQKVSGADIARLFVPGYDELPAWQRVSTAIAMDIFTDPLSLFGVAGMAMKGSALLGRGAAAGARAVGATPVAGVLEAASQVASTFGTTLFRADQAAQMLFNPYAQAIGAARAIGNLRLNDEGMKVADIAGEALERIMNITLFRTRHDIPGRISEITGGLPLTIGDFIFPRPVETYTKRWLNVPELFGGPATGPSAYLRARSLQLDAMHQARQLVEEMNRVLQDGLGTDTNFFGLFTRRVVPEERRPLMTEIQAVVHKILDEYGIGAQREALYSLGRSITQVAKSVGFNPDEALRIAEQYMEIGRKAILEMTYRVSGFDLYREIWKKIAQERGLDPEESWRLYSAWRTTAREGEPGFVVRRGEMGLELEEVPGFVEAPKKKSPVEPKIEKLARGVKLPDIVPPKQNEREIKDILDAVRGGRVATPVAEMGLYGLLPPLQQKETLENVERLRASLENLIKASNEAGSVEAIQTFAKEYRAFLAKADFLEIDDPQITAKAKTALQEAYNNLLIDKLPKFFMRLDEALPFIDREQLTALLDSPRAIDKTIGFLALAHKYFSVEDWKNGLIALSYAAHYSPSPYLSRLLYGFGAPYWATTIWKPEGEALKSLVGRMPTADELRDALQTDEITYESIYAVMAAAQNLPADALRPILGEAKGPLRELAEALVNKDKATALEIAQSIARGEVAATGDGMKAAAKLAVQLGAQPDEISPTIRTLLNIETQALEELWKVRPSWGGVADLEYMWWPVEGPKERVSPFSPLAVFDAIRNGYARKIYLGVLSPEATRAALLKGRLMMIPEVDPDGLRNKLGKWLLERGYRNAETAASEIAEYLKATNGRYVYTAETFMALLKSKGVQMSLEDFNAMMASVLGVDETAVAALLAQEKFRTMGMGQRALLAQKPELFQARIEGTEALLQFYNPEAALAELGRAVSREIMVSEFLNRAFEALKKAGLVKVDDQAIAKKLGIAELTADDVRSGMWVRIPDITDHPVRGVPIKIYGPLSGTFIPEPIYRHIVRSLSTDPLSSGAFAATLSFIRRSLLNYPATALVNIIGNSYLTWAFNPELAVEAAAQTPRAIRLLDEYYRTGRVPKEIEGAMYFLHETSLSREARTAVNEAIERLIREHPEVYQRGSVERFINKLDDWTNDLGGRIAEAIGKEDNPYIRLIMPLYTFAYAENVSRLANYLAARKMGADVERALWIASEATFNYADIPYALRLLRQYGLLAFPSFSYFIAKQSLSWAVQRPTALTLPQKTAQASFEEGVDKREDEWRLSVYMPEWLKSTLPMIVPVRTRSGEYIALPLGRILPLPAISGSTLTEPLNFGILQVFVDAANGVMRYFEDPTGRGIPTLAARYGDTMYRPLSQPEEALRGIAGYVVEKTLPRWLTQFLPGTDIPELLTLHLNGLHGKDDIAPLNSVRSLLGKLYVQYTHPAAVAALEERTGRQIGFLAAEAALGFLATPRRISVDIGGVSTRSSIMELERLEARIANSLRDTVLRYGEEEAKRRTEVALQKLRKAMRPYMMLNEALSKYGGE